MKIKKLFIGCMDLLFPPRCVFCNGVVSSGSQICAKCDAEISEVDSVKCIYIQEEGKTILCAVPYLYQNNVRQSIIRFKFYGQKQFAGLYAEKMVKHILQCYSSFQFDAVSSVPISSERRKLRGYNQSELIAREIAQQIKLPYCEYLIKIEDNKEQHKLKEKERRKNVKDVYRLCSAGCAQGKNILLIDDIVTTGATLSECAAVLLKNGAAMVACAAIAQVLP